MAQRKFTSTMIGSLPHTNAKEALECLDRNPLSLPAWPQLPKRGFREWMIPQYSEGFPGIRIDDNEKRIWLDRTADLLGPTAEFYEKFVAGDLSGLGISPAASAGFHAFVDKHKGRDLPAVKGQVTGPFTFGLGLNDQDGKAVWHDEQYRDLVIKGLAGKALWQARELKKVSGSVYIFIDEPILSAMGTAAYAGIQDGDIIRIIDEIITPLKEEGVKTGSHCCGNMDWGVLASTKLDIIAFDAYSYGDKVALYPDAIRAFLEREGGLAWGLVPTDSSEKLHAESADRLNEKMEGLLGLFTEKGLDRGLVLKNSLLTPSCGFGSLPVADADAVLKLLAELAK